MKVFTKNINLFVQQLKRYFFLLHLSISQVFMNKIKNKKFLLEQCCPLKKCCSNTWTKNIGLKAQSIVYDPNFRCHVAFCKKTTFPLVTVLHEVD